MIYKNSRQRPIHVLFVDDEADLLAIIKKRMKKRGFVVYTASGGRKALSTLCEKHVDVTVLDVRMPGMNGLDTLYEIKKKKPYVEVIMLSGHACIKSAVKSLEFGACDYLMKPVNITELIYRIEDACTGKEITPGQGKL